MIKDFIVKLMKEVNEEVVDDECEQRRWALSQAFRTPLRSSTYA